jgi:hypothetical protein
MHGTRRLGDAFPVHNTQSVSLNVQVVGGIFKERAEGGDGDVVTRPA